MEFLLGLIDDVASGAHVRVPTRRMTHGVDSVCVAKMPILNVSDHS